MKQMGNKVIAFLLCLMLLFSFTACAPSFKEPSAYADLPNSYNAGTDYPMNFLSTIHYSVAPCENGYYIIHNATLMFFDRETAASTPVCNRPECLHRNVNCPAYFSIANGCFIQSYENELYLEASEYDANGNVSYWLYRVNTQDCTRTKICQLPYDSAARNYAMHRGYLYMATLDVKKQTTVLERVALTELEEKSLTPERLFEAKTLSYGIPYLFGNYAFIIRNQTEGRGKTRIITTAINLNTLETKEIGMRGLPTNSYMQYQGFYEDRMIATEVDLDKFLAGDRSMTYYSYDPQTDVYEPYLTLPDRGEGVYEFYAWDEENHLAFYFDLSNAYYTIEQEFRILDENFETVKSIPVDYCVAGFLPGDADFTFFAARGETNPFVLYAIDKRGEELKVIKVFE